MTFASRELSVNRGEPIHLFTFRRGTLYARYCSADRPITIGADTYLPMAGGIVRTEIQDSQEQPKNNIKITMAKTSPIVEWWRPYPVGQKVFVACATVHYGDTELSEKWYGRVLAPTYTDKHFILACDRSNTNARKGGLPVKACRGCWKVHYSQGLHGCNVDRSLWAVTGTLEAVYSDGLDLISEAFNDLASGRGAGGHVEFLDSGGQLDRRTIVSASANTIRVNYGSSVFAIGLEVTAYPTCDGLWESCDFYDNTDWFGGIESIPEKNIFSGDAP